MEYLTQKPQQSINSAALTQVLNRGAQVTRKYNGFRANIFVDATGNIRVKSHTLKLDWTSALPDVVGQLQHCQFPALTWIDSEIYNPEDETVEGIQRILNNQTRISPRFAAFDLLQFNGSSIANQPCSLRWAQLRTLPQSDVIHMAEEVSIANYAEAEALLADKKWEGLVVAASDAPHTLHPTESKRGSTWKIKLRYTEDMLATGFSVGKDVSLGVAVLMLSSKINGQWKPVGKVGSFDRAFDRKQAMTAQYPYVVEVQHYGMDDAGHLTFPKILRKRTDITV